MGYMRKLLLSMVLACVGLALAPVASWAMIIIVPDPEIWPSPPTVTNTVRRLPPPPRPFSNAAFEIRSLTATIDIQDQVASTTVEQQIYNPNPRRLEGTFLFPIPKGASLEQFKMEIGGKLTEAELLPSDKARGIYEEIVRKTRDPALLEFAGQDLIKVRIFPFEPNETKRIQMSWRQLLPIDSGLVAAGFPLGVARHGGGVIQSASVKVNLKTAQPLKNIYSPSHQVEIKRPSGNQAAVSWEAANLVPERDFQLFFSAETAAVSFNLLTHRPAGEEGYFLLLATPGDQENEDAVLPKDVVFVVDTSGSMAGGKLEQARAAITLCVDNLNGGDRFDVVRFSTESQSLFKSVVEASEANRRRARQFVSELKPLGGTAINDALLTALANRPANSGDRPFMIIFLTDGLPTVGENNAETILSNIASANTAATRVFCFGIGTDVNTRLLDKLAETTRATREYVVQGENLELKVSSFFTKVSEPVLSDVRVAFEGVEVSRLHPGQVADLFKGEQVAVFGRYAGSGEARVVLTGRAQSGRKEFTHQFGLPATQSANDFIPRLWASRRVGYLLDEIRLRGESGELKDEVTALARKFGIVTPYTAYLVLEDEERRALPAQFFSNAANQAPEAKDALKLQYRELREKVSGESAVTASRFGSALQRQENLASVTDSFAAAPPRASASRQAGVRFDPATSSLPALAAGSVVAAKPAIQPAGQSAGQSAQNQRFAAGRAFYQNGDFWVDSRAQDLAKLKPRRIEFNSPEYFELLKHHPALAPVLALGQNLRFAFNGELVEIFETQ